MSAKRFITAAERRGLALLRSLPIAERYAVCWPSEEEMVSAEDLLRWLEGEVP